MTEQLLQELERLEQQYARVLASRSPVAATIGQRLEEVKEKLHKLGICP